MTPISTTDDPLSVSIRKVHRLAESKLDSTTNYLIGPETAIVDGIWENKIEKFPEIQRLLKLIEVPQFEYHCRGSHLQSLF